MLCFGSTVAKASERAGSFDAATFLASSVHNTTVVQRLGLFSGAQAFAGFENVLIDKEASEPSFERSPLTSPSYTEENYQQALSVLLKKWRRKRSDPESMATAIDQLAKYIASQPEAYAMLIALKQQPLKLVYSPANFTTVVKGNQFVVRSATIYFDPYSAAVFNRHADCEAQPGHCVASPADAFVHELIHARIALLDSARFIGSGALNTVMYPYAHEREVLKEERAIYSAMTSIDKKPRPNRQRHSGHLQAAACVTCLDAG